MALSAQRGGRLQLHDVSKHYGSTRVLSHVDLVVEDGEFLTIIGPSGCGKTTILRLIGGFASPSHGRILFRDEDITGVPTHRRPFNTVFQDYALFPHMTVSANVGYGLMVRGVDKAETGRQVAESLEVVGLEGVADRFPAELSGGQQQRVALARALICSPDVILLDEPLAALDAELRRQMQQFLKSIQRRIGVTFVFVTHDQEEAITLSDRICLIRDGGIEQIGTPETIYYRPRSEFVATFFGDNNRIPGTKRDRVDGLAWRIETVIGTVLSSDERLSELADNVPLTLAIRPEALRIAEADDTAAPHADNRLQVKVESAEFVGPLRQLQVTSLAGSPQTLQVKVPSRPGDNTVEPGDSLTLLWEAADCAIIPESPSSPAC